MEPSRAETIFAKIIKAGFNHFTLSSVLFVLCALMIPLYRLYCYVYPALFFLMLVVLIIFTALLPFIYQKQLKKRKIDFSIRELLMMTLVLNILTFLLIQKFAGNTISIFVQSSFLMTFIVLALMFIESFFTTICTTSTVMTTVAIFVLANVQNKSFIVISTVLILLGLFLSLLIAGGKSTLKQENIGILTAVLSLILYSLLPV